MRKIIIGKLQQIEKQENVRILHAVESGSRAWGFESPDSDFDVRFIYVRPHDYYLKLEQTRDVLEFPINDLLDVNGWDLQKATIGSICGERWCELKSTFMFCGLCLPADGF